MTEERNYPKLQEIIGYDCEVSVPNGPAVHGYILARWMDEAQKRFEEWLDENYGVIWEYGIANYGDLEDVLVKPDAVAGTAKEWAEKAVNAQYGDFTVRRRARGPWERVGSGE